MNVTTRAMAPGERSLPAELRTARGRGFAARRLRNGMQGVTGVGWIGDAEGDVGAGPVATDVPTTPIDATPIDTTTFPDTSFPVTFTDPSTIPVAVTAPYVAPSGVPTTVPMGTTPPPAPSGYQWIQAANNTALSLAKVLAVSQGGTVMQLPNGQQVITGTPGGSTLALSGAGVAGQLTAYLPWLLLAGGALLLFQMSRR